MKSYTVYLLRHGLTKGNLNAQYIGHTDYPLSTFGIEQLKEIKKEHPYPEVDAVFVSPLKRAMESADIMGIAILFIKLVTFKCVNKAIITP